MADDGAANAPQPRKYQWSRDLLALTVVGASLIGVAALGAVGIYRGETAKEILSMLLEAANRTVESLARQLTSEDKVRSIKVTEKMIPRSDAFIVTQEPGDMKLLDTLDSLGKQQKRNRVPIFTAQGQPRYVVQAVPSIALLPDEQRQGRLLMS